MLGSGCDPVTFKPAFTFGKACPALTSYSKEEQAAADSELATIPPPCVTCRFMDDYLLLRDQCR